MSKIDLEDSKSCSSEAKISPSVFKELRIKSP
jgi:hypothetical protein